MHVLLKENKTTSYNRKKKKICYKIENNNSTLRSNLRVLIRKWLHIDLKMGN